MRRKCILFIVLLLSVCGCSIKQDSSEKGEILNMGINDGKIDDNAKNSVEVFFDLYKQDQYGDGKSVYWNGDSAELIDDELDSVSVDDGRAILQKQEYCVDKLIRFDYPADLQITVENAEEPDSCHMTGVVDIFTKQVNYTDEISKFDNDSNYMEIDQNFISKNQSKYFENYTVYVGIKDINQEKKAGYALVFKCNYDDKAYLIESYGIGNLENIKLYGLMVMNHFDILF